MSNGILNKANTALLVIDLQERLMPVIAGKDDIFKNTNILIDGCVVLNVPIVITEQYPKGLGHTCAEVKIPEGNQPIEKVCFSCVQSTDVLNTLNAKNIRSLILCGVEAHICVLKTVLEAVQRDFEVHVIADAIGSRVPYNKEIALIRMQQAGAFITTSESVLFQMLNEAGNDEFKAISKLIR